MALKRPPLWLIVAAVVMALAGLIAVQVYLLTNAFELKEQAFKQNVTGALGMTSIRLATNETMANVFRIDAGGTAGGATIVTTEVRTTRPSGQGRVDSVFAVQRVGPPMPVRVEGDSFIYTISTPQRVRILLADGTGKDSLVVDTLKPAGEHRLLLHGPGRGQGFFYRFSTDSFAVVANITDSVPPAFVRKPENEQERQVLVSRVMENLWVSDREPLERRIHPTTLDTVLRRSLREVGIPLEVTYGVLLPGDSIAMAVPPEQMHVLRTSSFRAPLFLAEGASPRTFLVVFFPGQQLYLLQQLWPVLLASVLFVTLVVGGFVHTIRTIVRQQKLSGLMVDFINNMTHEFKTPISTVALASEAIGRPDVVTKRTKVRQYNRIIAEETLRMKVQVDRILQMAQLEEGDIELTRSEVDLHALIGKAAGTFALQVESRGGRIAMDLRAGVHRLSGDPVFLSNIVHNLLDNANKYSPEAPEITIATFNDGGMLVVRISDRGCGIAAEHQTRIFEKYYRVPAGDLHDVKGFGIGLSYVKLLVEAHGGSISLHSEPGVGTDVEVRLPVKTTML
jgi:two-component system phosphate regulon sensor histidine kinase PhoR